MTPSKFPVKKPKERVSYSTMNYAEQVKRVGITLVYWSNDTRISPGIRHKLRLISPESMVMLFNKYDGWQLYGNRRIGVVEKVNIILDIWTKARL